MKTIAYIDDEPLICRIFSLRLRVPGCVIQTFSDPDEALRALTASPPDLVISDYWMPRLTGLDLMARLSGVPFIIVTGGMIDDPRRRDDRVHGVIAKPVDFDALEKQVLKLLG